MFIPVAVGWQTGIPPRLAAHTQNLTCERPRRLKFISTTAHLCPRDCLNGPTFKWRNELDDVRNPLGLMMIVLILTCWPCSIPEPGSGSSSHSPPMFLLWIPPSLAWVAPNEPFQCWWTGGRSGTDDPRPLTPGRAGFQGWKLVWREELVSQWKLVTFSE